MVDKPAWIRLFLDARMGVFLSVRMCMCVLVPPLCVLCLALLLLLEPQVVGRASVVERHVVLHVHLEHVLRQACPGVRFHTEKGGQFDRDLVRRRQMTHRGSKAL